MHLGRAKCGREGGRQALSTDHLLGMKISCEIKRLEVFHIIDHHHKFFSIFTDFGFAALFVIDCFKARVKWLPAFRQKEGHFLSFSLGGPLWYHTQLWHAMEAEWNRVEALNFVSAAVCLLPCLVCQTGAVPTVHLLSPTLPMIG